VFNKCDVQSSDTLVEWVNDYQKFMDAAHQDESYLATLSYSLCLSLEEFYKDLNVKIHLMHKIIFNIFNINLSIENMIIFIFSLVRVSFINQWIWIR
jgi:hypothetical protein